MGGDKVGVVEGGRAGGRVTGAGRKTAATAATMTRRRRTRVTPTSDIAAIDCRLSRVTLRVVIPYTYVPASPHSANSRRGLRKSSWR